MLPSHSHKPSLDNAYSRVNRARQHLTRLKREVSAFYKREKIAGMPPPPDGIRSIAFVHYLEDEIPVENWGILVGECVYNLRAALDYLVAELALFDSGQVQKGTQFPIEDQEEGWQGKLKTGYLKGLSSGHKAIIERFQPWKGCEWTRVLRGLSNPDKHVTLTMLSMTKLAINPTFPNDGDAPVKLAPNVFEARSTPVNVYCYIPFEPSSGDGNPIEITLGGLIRDVAGVLECFNTEIK
jgi:hypothetical protein